MEFEWDDRKEKRNLIRHGVSFGEAKTVFDDQFFLVFADPDHSYEEQRFIIMGESNKGRLLVVAYTEMFDEDLDDDLRPEYDFNRMQVVARGPKRAVEGLARLHVTKKTGDEYFRARGQGIGLKLLDFWRWYASDLVDNTKRGILAEFIVAHALGLTDEICHVADSYDLETPSGVKIEVKSAAYLQSWFQSRPSTISFSIRPARKWTPETNRFTEEIKRHADIYVFCILKHLDKSTLDPLDQWEFLIIRAQILNEAFPTQKTIRLSSLLKLNPCVASYPEIKPCIDALSQEVSE